MLQIGQTAPGFVARDIYDNEITLAKDKFSFLTFHRFAACPFCVLRTRELIKAYPLFEQHQIEIISIWPSSKDNMLKYAGSEKAPFAMIADDKKKLFEKYLVVEKSGRSVFKLLWHPLLIWRAMHSTYRNMRVDADPRLLPTEFLVSPQGEIVIAFYGKHYGDHIDIQQLFSTTLKTN
ncbi:MAG: redoxin domain-containing protein [Cytophagaceae bacterium]|jgi:peroxiredoxin|nr:redoxin domain-containing protein [Cytophagaceae bacterium]